MINGYEYKCKNFLKVKMTPEQYGKCIHQHDITDIESLVFDKDSGTFSVLFTCHQKSMGSMCKTRLYLSGNYYQDKETIIFFQSAA